MTVLIEHFQLGLEAARQLPLFQPRYNIAPTQDILVIRAEAKSGEREAALLRWGLIPVWAKDPHAGPPLINARGETVAEKSTFRHALRRRRCLIPADGFFEWQQTPGVTSRGKKQPYLIHRRDNGPLAFAGLWDSWISKASKHSRGGAGDREPLRIESCTIVTTAANATLAPLHDRMPVILSPGDYARWLDPAVREPAAVADLLVPSGHEELVAEPVSTHVNRVANDGPECVAVQRTLFDGGEPSPVSSPGG
jgi:putative SOS response-associated peptidase YedK